MEHDTLFIRGTTVDSARRFIDRSRGHGGWGAFWEQLSPDQRHLMEGNIRPKGWYVVAEYMSVISAAADHLSPESRVPFLEDLGRFVMEDGVNTLYKAFFAIASPSFVIRVSALFWFQFYKGSRLKITSRGKRWVEGVIYDAPYCSLDLCHSTKGAMIAALERAGARDVKVEQHLCQSEGAERCTFRFMWR